MLKAADIQPLRAKSSDYKVTEELKSRFAELRVLRRPFYLTAEELDDVFHWKLGRQYGRAKRLLAQNSGAFCRAVTEAAFAVQLQNWEDELHLRVRILSTLNGIEVPVASAILALVDPTRYCVIDFRGWRAIFKEDRRQFNIEQYWQYLQKVKSLADELGWCIQETDLAIWQYDYQRNPP